MKVIKLKNYLTVILEDGTILSTNNCTEELYKKVMENIGNEDLILELLVPEYKNRLEEFEAKTEIIEGVKKSKHLTFVENKAYLKDISDLIVPEELVEVILKAENEGNSELIQTYKNFWTLCSLNPNAEARKNLFWFLARYGMRITKSGLFVAYRNVKLKKEGKKIDHALVEFVSEQYSRVKWKLKKSPKNYYVGYGEEGELKINIDSSKLKTTVGVLDELYFKLSDEQGDESPTYTDGHTGKFSIKIGQPVTMERSKCDESSYNTCSRGLHVAGRSWLTKGYFGNISLICLVNPADVVAVPPQDNYGKMRTCAYYPVAVVQRDEEGNIVNDEFEDGFEDDFMNLISYAGEKNTEENLTYSFKIPDVPEINRKNIIDKLDSISKKLNKYVN